MPGSSPYRSRLFRHVHHLSIRTVRRTQRAWREIKAAAANSVQAIAYSFHQMWQRVQASHLQVAPPSKIHRLGQPANSDGHQVASNRSSKAIARVLNYARTMPYLGEGSQPSSLQAPSLTQSANEAVTVGTSPSVSACQAKQIERISVKISIRAMASHLEHRQLVLVTRHNDILDCLTAQQQTEILRRIDTELAQLSVLQPIQLAPQPHNWQQSIDRLVFPARRLRQLSPATEKLVQFSVDAIQSLSQTTARHPWISFFQEAIATIPTTAAKSIEAPVRLALPPSRQLAKWVQSPLQELRSRMMATLPSQSAINEAMLFPALDKALAWRTLQQQFQFVWNREDSTESNGSSALPVYNSLGALPFGRTQWVKNFLKLSRPKAIQEPQTSEAEGYPLLPPMPPLKLLKPATIGFLRPEARSSVVLRRSPVVAQQHMNVTAIPPRRHSA